MPNNPVQIVLNDRDFLRAPEPRTPGPHKDFFEDADKAFREHRAELAASIDRAETAIEESGFEFSYLKVRMRKAAIAKSYRPNRALFERNLFPCVGADDIGTLYFRAPLMHLHVLRDLLLRAEDTVAERISANTGMPYKAPTRLRSEVGAIQSIETATPADKRTFSVMAAVGAFRDPRTVSGYLIELFETPGNADYKLRDSLKAVLMEFGPGARTSPLSRPGWFSALELRLTRGDHDAIAVLDDQSDLPTRASDAGLGRAPVDPDPERHERALVALAGHPLVRRIHPPIQLVLANQEEPTSQNESQNPHEAVEIPDPETGGRYPVVGVIDSGVGPFLDSWIIGRFDYLPQSDYDAEHGTEVAGLLTAGQRMNAPDLIPEPDGYRIFDIHLFPKKPDLFLRRYPRGFWDFLEEMDHAIEEASSGGVRIFNLSINALSDVERYGPYAQRLDEISDRHGVLIVNSAGNLHPSRTRKAWPIRPGEALSYLATRVETDTRQQPSESVRSISVGALNPPNIMEVAGAPTRYTTRGPGLRVGVKPDVATYGGGADEPSGLFSVGLDGRGKSVRGTSFAAPLVARILANLDTVTQNALSLEALRAMLIHHTSMPDPLRGRRRAVREIARQFAGFGRPYESKWMLETDDHQITMVFQSRLTIRGSKPSILRFDFSWPQSLVDKVGRCSGRARMTLVYAPPLNPAFGDEFVRVNIDAKLSQRRAAITRKDGNPSYINQIKPLFGWGSREKTLIDHGLKWWPVKQYESTLTTPRGETSNWRLEIISQVRAEDSFPDDGVPFAVILTIEDPDGVRPIFTEMRQLLAASGANIMDIRSDIRVGTS